MTVTVTIADPTDLSSGVDIAGLPIPVTTAAQIRAVHRETLLRAIRSGRLRSYPTPGGHHRVTLADVNEAFPRPYPPAV